MSGRDVFAAVWQVEVSLGDQQTDFDYFQLMTGILAGLLDAHQGHWPRSKNFSFDHKSDATMFGLF